MQVSHSTLGIRLRALLGVEAGEERAIGMMVLLYFALAASFVFVQTSAYGLFIQEFGARQLPFAYLSIAVLASSFAFLYLQLSHRLGFQTLLLVNLGMLAIVCLVFWLGLRSHLAHWFIFFLPLWFQVLLNLSNLVVWPLAGRMFDLRQAKRLFGLVSAGNWLANILGGLVIPPILAFAGAPNLYLFAAIAILGAGGLLWAIFRGHLLPASREPAADVSQRHREGEPASPFRYLYNRLIFAYILLWWVSFYFIDNIFFDRAALQYPDGAQLAAFISRQISVVGVIAILASTFLTGRIIRQFGLRIGLLAMPAVVTACTVLLAAAGWLGAPLPALFWLATIAKTLNLALGFSLSLASSTLLYQPILGSARNRTQTIAEGIVQPLAIGVAGLLLLLFNTTLHFNAVGLSTVFLLIALAWLWVILRLSREYPHVLSEALVTRSLGESTTLLFDPAGIAHLRSSLKSPHAGVVLYSLNQLEQLEPNAWHTTLTGSLPDLLDHPAPDVRSYVIQRMLSVKLEDQVPLVLSRLPAEPDPQVYANMVQFLTALDDRLGDDVMIGVDSSEPVVRQGAIIGLLLSGSAHKVDRAKAMLDALAGSKALDDRLLAANILADAACPGSERMIARLLCDEIPAVRQAAVRAAGRQGKPELLRQVVAVSSDSETAHVTEEVLVSRSAAALPAVLEALKKVGRAVDIPGTVVLVRVLGRIGGEEAREALGHWLNCPDGELRLQVLRSLSDCGYHIDSRGHLQDLLRSELEQAAWILAALDLLGGSGSRDLVALSEALNTAFVEARERVMLLLSFGLHSPTALRAARALNRSASNSFALAVEAVDAMLPSAWKRWVLPLIENIPSGERLSRWHSAGIRVSSLSVESLVGSLLSFESGNRFSRWVTLCALHAAGARRLASCAPALEARSHSPDASISGLSCWSLAQMNPEVLVQGGAAMLSLVEKVLALRSASLFHHTPHGVLVDVAERLEELSFDKGQIIFEKGDRGDSLYIIVSGKVDVRDGDRLLNELGEGAIFGELALLDPAARSASVQAVEPANLLRLDEANFRLVLAERPEVATAVIHVLTSYIRSLLAGDGAAGTMKSPELLEA